MPTLSIPEAIVENTNLNANAKFAFADCFARLKKGEKVEVTLSNVSEAIALSTEDLIGSLRQLAAEGYAYIDETVDRLEDMVVEQKMRLTVHIHAEPLPLYPTDEFSVNQRRYKPAYLEEPGFDVVKVGRMIYRATVSRWMTEYSLTVRARHGDNPEQSTLVDAMPFQKENDAWRFFDSFIEDARKLKEEGKVLPGAAGDDPHGKVVAALVEQGWDEAEARAASEATIGEGDPDMRIQAATRWLIAKRPPKALPSPIDPEDDPEEKLFRNAAIKVCWDQECSRASLRRDFGLSASRADDLMDRLEAEGVIGPKMGAAPRKAIMGHCEAVKRFGAKVVEEIATDNGEEGGVDLEITGEGDELPEDEAFAQAARLVVETRIATIALLKIRLKVGHQRAIVLLDRLHRSKVIDDMGNPQPKVLMSAAEVEAMLKGAGDE